jgi:uncharacterized membrane protein
MACAPRLPRGAAYTRESSPRSTRRTRQDVPNVSPLAGVAAMHLLVVALLIGIVAGMRAVTAPAVVSWAASLGVLPLMDTPLAFLGWRATPWLISLLAIGELIADQLPRTPSRKVPLQFATRIALGGLCGAAVGMAGGLWVTALVAGALGAVLGTFGGAAARAAMARRFGRDQPAALLEDAAAIALGVLAMALLR